MEIEVYGGEQVNMVPTDGNYEYTPGGNLQKVVEGEVEPKFPLTVYVLVPYEHKFETKEAFDEYLKNDLLQMGYTERDEEDDDKITWSETDKEAWKENYEGVPFPPKSVQDYLAYTRQDVDGGRYGFDELDFDEADMDQFQWFIREEKAK